MQSHERRPAVPPRCNWAMARRSCSTSFAQRPGRIAGHRRTIGYLASDDRAHSDHRAGPDLERRARFPLADDGSGPDVGMIADVHVAVALNARRESDEIADHAVVLDIGIKVGV